MAETTQTNQEPQDESRRILAEQASTLFRRSHAGLWGLVGENFVQICHDLFVVAFIAGAVSVTDSRTEGSAETPEHADN